MSMFAEDYWRTEQPKSPPSNARHIDEEELRTSYRGRDRQGRGNYPVSKTYSRDDEKLERLQNEALFTAIMADLGNWNIYTARKVEQVLRRHLGLPPETKNQKP